MARKKNIEVVLVEAPVLRSPLVVAMQRRHGYGVKVMKDRRSPRGGSKRPDHHEGW